MIDQLPYRPMGGLGIAYLLMVVIPLSIAPLPPFGPDADLVAFNTANHDALLLSNYLAAFQPPIVLIFLVFVAAVTRQAEESSRGWQWLLILAASVCTVAVTIVDTFFVCAEPFVVKLGQPVLALITQISLYGFLISFAMQALLLGAIGVAALRLHFLPAWLGFVALLAAAVSALGTLGLLMTAGPFTATSPIALFASPFSLPVWITLVSIYWLVHPASHAPPVAAR